MFQPANVITFFTCVQSSLLSSILGELPDEKGVLKVRGQLTYAAQQPWVFPGTIRSNILFGKELNPQKYERVIKACALKRVRESLIITCYCMLQCNKYTLQQTAWLIT